MKKQLAIFCVLSACVSFAQVVSVDFENQSEGAYTNAQARNDFVPLRGASSWYAMEQNKGQNAKIVLDDQEHGKVLQLKYPVGCLGPMMIHLLAQVKLSSLSQKQQKKCGSPMNSILKRVLTL